MKKLVTGAMFAATLVAPRVAVAQAADRVTYQGVEIRPGDVINFYGGLITAVGGGADAAIKPVARGAAPVLTYGHTALYLGVDPQTHHRVYLDFTWLVQKQRQQPFGQRIVPEVDFLTINQREHTEFDVFRLDDTTRIDQRRLLREAKQVAVPDRWFLFSDVCTTAVAKVLSNTTGLNIRLLSPDSFMAPPFHKLPELQHRTISVAGALREAQAVAAIDTRATQVRQVQAAAAQQLPRRTLLTADEFTRLTAGRRQHLLDAQWDYLKTLVGYACSAPGDLGTLNQQGAVPSVALDFIELDGYVARDRRRFSGCENEIFNRILASGGPLPIETLIDLGVTYRSQHGALVALKKLNGKIKAFGSALGRAFSSIGESGDEDGSSSSGSGSSSGSSSRSGSSTSSRGSGNNEALGQLRGIAAAGKGIPRQ